MWCLRVESDGRTVGYFEDLSVARNHMLLCKSFSGEGMYLTKENDEVPVFQR